MHFSISDKRRRTENLIHLKKHLNFVLIHIYISCPTLLDTLNNNWTPQATKKL
jgi:hypothetical protein